MRDDLQHMRDKATELELKVDRVRGRGRQGRGLRMGQSVQQSH